MITRIPIPKTRMQQIGCAAWEAIRYNPATREAIRHGQAEPGWERTRHLLLTPYQDLDPKDKRLINCLASGMVDPSPSTALEFCEDPAEANIHLRFDAGSSRKDLVEQFKALLELEDIGQRTNGYRGPKLAGLKPATAIDRLNRLIQRRVQDPAILQMDRRTFAREIEEAEILVAKIYRQITCAVFDPPENCPHS